MPHLAVNRILVGSLILLATTANNMYGSKVHLLHNIINGEDCLDFPAKVKLRMMSTRSH
jgi:hypothetical protein